MAQDTDQVIRSCDWCHEPFLAKQQHQRFCSSSHRAKWHTQQKITAEANRIVHQVLHPEEEVPA